MRVGQASHEDANDEDIVHAYHEEMGLAVQMNEGGVHHEELTFMKYRPHAHHEEVSTF
jgi:hypothetical protein